MVNVQVRVSKVVETQPNVPVGPMSNRQWYKCFIYATFELLFFSVQIISQIVTGSGSGLF